MSLIFVLFHQARERRDGVNKDYEQQTDLPSTTADYRAVAPDAKPYVGLYILLEQNFFSSIAKCNRPSIIVRVISFLNFFSVLYFFSVQLLFSILSEAEVFLFVILSVFESFCNLKQEVMIFRKIHLRAWCLCKLLLRMFPMEYCSFIIVSILSGMQLLVHYAILNLLGCFPYPPRSGSSVCFGHRPPELVSLPATRLAAR